MNVRTLSEEWENMHSERVKAAITELMDKVIDEAKNGGVTAVNFMENFFYSVKELEDDDFFGTEGADV